MQCSCVIYISKVIIVYSARPTLHVALDVNGNLPWKIRVIRQNARNLYQWTKNCDRSHILFIFLPYHRRERERGVRNLRFREKPFVEMRNFHESIVITPSGERVRRKTISEQISRWLAVVQIEFKVSTSSPTDVKYV